MKAEKTAAEKRLALYVQIEESLVDELIFYDFEIDEARRLGYRTELTIEARAKKPGVLRELEKVTATIRRLEHKILVELQ